MSTNGTYGFRIDGVDKVGYNHWDSYPSGLGRDTIATVRKYTDEQLRDAARRVVVAGHRSDGHLASVLDQSRYMLFADTNVDDCRLDNWYVLLRRTQGDLDVIVDGRCNHLLTGETFTSQEWGYCVDMDQLTLTVYENDTQIANIPLDFLRQLGEDQVKKVLSILEGE